MRTPRGDRILAEWSASLSEGTRRTPEQMLMLAILERAIRDLFQPSAELAKDARKFLLSRSRAPFSCVHICDTFGLKPENLWGSVKDGRLSNEYATFVEWRRKSRKDPRIKFKSYVMEVE